jgi:hypothetical protein
MSQKLDSASVFRQKKGRGQKAHLLGPLAELASDLRLAYISFK